MKINLYIFNFNKVNMKKIIFETVKFVFPVFILLILVNYFGDAARLFDNDYEKEMANILSSDHNVTNVVNYDERLLQKELILQKEVNPDVVVIGSSRSMLINSAFFSNSKFFNNSVSGASMQDLIGIYQLYKQNHKLPKKIIIGIDPWLFKEDKNIAEGRWQSIEEFYNSFHGVKIKQSPSYYKYKQLYSISYFQSSLKLIPNLFLSDNKPIPSKIKYNHLNTKLIDGSLTYGEAYRNASESEIELKMKKYIKGDVYNIQDMKEISKKKYKEFEQLMNDLAMNNVEVEFFLAPYAPLVFDVLEEKYMVVLNVEKTINDYAVLNNIKIYGSFNPYSLGLDKTFFYDGMHCKENAIIKIFQSN